MTQAFVLVKERKTLETAIESLHNFWKDEILPLFTAGSLFFKEDP